MFCSSCGNGIKEGAKFCSGCGNQINPQVSNNIQEPINRQMPYEQASSANQSAIKDGKVYAIICFVLSLIGFVIFLYASMLVGFILSLIGDVFGYLGIKSSYKYLSIIGMVISLVIFIWWMVI